MSHSIAAWVVAAVLVFWAVGAYNRLVRLRSEANAAFAVLGDELQRQVALVQSSLPGGETQPASLVDGEATFWGSLQGAASQFAASLAAARLKPLEPGGIAALQTARDVLALAWERAEREDAHDLAGARLPETLTGERQRMVLQAQAAAEQFDQAVARYNEAVRQFPAVLLAWLFGFQPARGMGQSA